MEHEGEFPRCYKATDIAQARCYRSDVETNVIDGEDSGEPSCYEYIPFYTVLESKN